LQARRNICLFLKPSINQPYSVDGRCAGNIYHGKNNFNPKTERKWIAYKIALETV